MDPSDETQRSWEKVAQAYEAKFMDLDLYEGSYDFFCAQLPQPKARILDIGCGPGNIARYLMNQRPDFQLEGIDLSTNMIELAKANVPAAQFQVLDVRAIDQIKVIYDGIICGFCIPYLSFSEVEKFIADSYRRLANSGIFYLSFVPGPYNQSGYLSSSSGDRMYFYFYELEKLLPIFTNCGFTLLWTFDLTYPKDVQNTERHLIVILKK